jgi:hypothetical protein
MFGSSIFGCIPQKQIVQLSCLQLKITPNTNAAKKAAGVDIFFI